MQLLKVCRAFLLKVEASSNLTRVFLSNLNQETVNGMIYKMRIFSSEVTRVSREVGAKGRLGKQAVVAGLEGTWKTCKRFLWFMYIFLPPINEFVVFIQ